MRYQCPQCKQWVKDKFIFGLLHVCISDEIYLNDEETVNFCDGSHLTQTEANNCPIHNLNKKL